MEEGRPSPGFARRLTLFDATMIVISGIIGSGIFINPYVVARAVHTPFLILGVWIAGGLIALFGAFVFAELSTVMPRVGGQYAFFREAFSPIVAFLYGWGLLLIVQSGATAAVAVAFAQYVARLVDLPPGSERWLAGAILLAVAAFHALGIKPGAVLLNVITFTKTLALAALIVGAFLLTRHSGLTFEPLAPPDLGGLSLLSAFFAGLVPAMFAYGGWQNLNYVAEEVKEPQRNLPRAILIGVFCVIAVYVSANVAYVHVLGAPALAATRTPAADVAAQLMGETGAKVISLLIVVSTFGFLNLSLLSAPRVYYAMAADGLFFRSLARLSPRFRAPTARHPAPGGHRRRLRPGEHLRPPAQLRGLRGLDLLRPGRRLADRVPADDARRAAAVPGPRLSLGAAPLHPRGRGDRPQHLLHGHPQRADRDGDLFAGGAGVLLLAERLGREPDREFRLTGASL